MKLHQFFEARQMKDPTKDTLVSKDGKVIVIDKSKEKDYLKKGWELAEAYPVYKTKDYIDRQDRNLKKTPEEKPKKVTKLSDLVKDLSGKSTKLKDFGKGIFKFDRDVKEGTWALPDTEEQMERLKELMAKPLPCGPGGEFATEKLGNLIGDDELFDDIGELGDSDPNADCRDIVIARAEEFGINLKKGPNLRLVDDEDYYKPRSKREKEQAKNSATNEFTPDHIHNAMMKRVKAYDKTRKTEGTFIDQLEPEWSEGKRRLGNELRAKLGMKKKPALDWKKDKFGNSDKYHQFEDQVEEGEERSDVQALMREKCEEWLANVQPGSYLGYEDLESDMYDYARGLTHDDLGSSDGLRNFMDNPGDEAGQVVQDVLASNHRVEIEDLFAEGVDKADRTNSKEENQVCVILGKALGKDPGEALQYTPQELFSELESVNPELADSIASISSIVYNVKLEEKYDGYYLAQKAADLWHDDNPDKKRDGYWRAGVDVQDNYAEKAGGKKGKYLGKGASEWTTEEVKD